MPLHASAIRTPRGAVLFAGHSGIGKSTLLAALTERGHALIADDVTGIDLDAEGRPVALSSFPGVQLWAPAMAKLGWDRTRAREKVRAGREKYEVPIDRFADTPTPLRGIFVLTAHNRESFAIEPAAPAAALALLAEHTYRRWFIPGMSGLEGHFRVVAATAKHARLATVTRPAIPFWSRPWPTGSRGTWRRRDPAAETRPVAS